MKTHRTRGSAAKRHPMPEDPGSYVRETNGSLTRTDTPQEAATANEAAPAPVLPEASRQAIADALLAAGAEVPAHLAGGAEPIAPEDLILLTPPPAPAGSQAEDA